MTYQDLAERIINAHYNNFANPESTITLRFIAGRIAQKVAQEAVKNAYANGDLEEATYANDQFIVVFNNVQILTDQSTGNKYCAMPAIPAGLPRGREIAQVSFSGQPNIWCVPMQNRYEFIYSGLPKAPIGDGIQLFKLEGQNIIFYNLPNIISSTVNLKLVGAVLQGDALLTQNISAPKNVEDFIFREILEELATRYEVKPSNIYNAKPN